MEKLTVYVDRIETFEQSTGNQVAVLLLRLEEGVYREWHIPLSFLPDGTQEGDVLRVLFEPDQQEKAALKKRVESLMTELFDDKEAAEDG
jgi:hypothetical protein